MAAAEPALGTRQQTFRTADGLALAYSDVGTGPPVLCLPGLTRNSADFDDFAAAAGDRVRLIRLTSRGRGASDHDPDPRNYAVPVEARDAAALLDHLGLAKATIVGTSRGGILAMFLAATAQDRLAGVLLNDIGPVIEAEGLSHIETYLGRDPEFQTYDAAADALPIRNAATFPGVSRARWRACAERWWRETPQGLRIRYDPRLRDAVLDAQSAPAPDLWPLFDALTGVPLALVHGANSDLLSARTVAAMQARRPDMITARVPDRGHVPFLDEPPAVAAFASLMRQVAP